MNHEGPEGASASPEPGGQSKPSAVRAWAKRTESADPAGHSAFDHNLRQMEPSGTAGAVRVPFPVASRSSYLSKIKGKGIFEKAEKTTPTDVPLDQLHAIQRTVNVEQLTNYANDPGRVKPGTRAPGHGGLIDKPVVVKVDGKMHIHDGHHRLAAQMMKGATHAKARVIDLDNPEK